MADAIE